MTPEQEARVREELDLIIAKAEANSGLPHVGEWWAIREYARNALAALDGEGEREEWTAEPSGERRHLGNAHERPHWHVRRANATIVASTFTEQNARQIASDHNRCAKLKRAAREVDKAIDAYDTARSLYGSDDPRRIARIRQLTEARGNLRAFLNDEGKP